MIQLTITKKGLRADSALVVIKKALEERFGKDISISISRKEPAESRADRFEEATGFISDAKSIAEELRDEMESWKDSIPENLQNGDKASQIEDCVSSLEEFIYHCDSAENESPEFPSMM